MDPRRNGAAGRGLGVVGIEARVGEAGWAKQGGPAPINARLESVASNGMFRSAFAGQRCLVPMAGYYEWQQMEDGKQPYFIHGDGDVLAAAGVYAARQEDDEWKISFTIITRAARDASGEIHDRMPVFLTPDVWDQWLRPEKISDKEQALSMLDRSSVAIAKTVTAYPVARVVNNLRTLDSEDPELIRPAARRG
ncbi:SOS response-associated peptidase [Cryobacterium sp. TMT2-23]|uniref:SOS response-associated peptidase n=1 Tax=Cryobacterium sp. TMT2-23 TaxID=1259252 RepID=UPI0018E0AD9F|nr:SOS response-associated peptidase [Cryobacterium sp. TMT2-23]